jgi:hypothetical protein
MAVRGWKSRPPLAQPHAAHTRGRRAGGPDEPAARLCLAIAFRTGHGQPSSWSRLGPDVRCRRFPAHAAGRPANPRPQRGRGSEADEAADDDDAPQSGDGGDSGEDDRAGAGPGSASGDR